MDILRAIRPPKYTDRAVARRGRDEGRLDPPIPPWNAEEQPPTVIEIEHALKVDLDWVARAWSRANERLHAGWKAARARHAAAGEALGRASSDLEAAECEYERARRATAPATDFRFGVYYVVCAVLGLCMLPFDVGCFRQAAQSEVLTAVVALGLALVMAVDAHLAGGFIRKRNYAAAAALVVVAGAVIVGTGCMRAQYAATPPAPVAPAVESLDGPPPGRAAAVPQATPGGTSAPSMLTFTVINGLLFLVMLMYSVMIHDPQLENVFRLRRTVDTRRAECSAAGAALARTRARRLEAQAHAVASAEQLVKNANRLVEVYRSANLSERNDRGAHAEPYPRSFGKPVGADIPLALYEMRWDDAQSSDARAEYGGATA